MKKLFGIIILSCLVGFNFVWAAEDPGRAQRLGLELISAIDRRRWDRAQKLIDEDADIRVRSSVDEATALHWAAAQGKRDIVSQLLDRGAVIDAPDKRSLTALHWAAAQGKGDIVSQLLDRGAVIDGLHTAQETPLFIAIYHSHRALAKMLINRGANIHATDRFGTTCLMEAARFNFPEIVDILIEKGARVDVANEFKETALILAAQSGSVETVGRLIKEVEDVDASDTLGRTALMLAAKGRDPKAIVPKLINAGADPLKRDDKKKRAIDYVQPAWEHQKLLLREAMEIEALRQGGGVSKKIAKLISEFASESPEAEESE